MNYNSIINKHGSPLLLLSKDVLKSQYENIIKALPNTTMHYAIKACPNPFVIKQLDKLGCSFDCCTPNEIKLLQKLNISPNKCIYTHPIKKNIEIEKAIEFGCGIFVADNIHEIKKMIPYKNKIKLLLRISFRSENALIDLSWKFGAEENDAIKLIQFACENGISIVGLSFHVGSQNENARKYQEAIESCSHIITELKEQNIQIELLDIGGGFPVEYLDPVMNIEEFCKPINASLSKLDSKLKIIAEPGRYISAPAMTLISTVVGKSLRQGIMWYYLDDGIYNSYSGKIFDHADYPFSPITKRENAKTLPSIVAGPTCDSFDIIYKNIKLPELEIGDIVSSSMMGAYSLASASNFCSFDHTKVVEI